MSSNNNLRPETSDQFSAGYFANVRESLYDFSAELYYKSFKNQLDFRNGSQLVANLQVEKQLAFGIGRAYGLELLFKKKTGLLTCRKLKENSIKLMMENGLMHGKTGRMNYPL
jgi:outer membrane cobalamin receptor